MSRKTDTTPKKKKGKWKSPSLNVRQKRKLRRNKGCPYIDYKKEIKKERFLGPPCRCKGKCRERVNGNEARIFNAFWDMGDYNAQNAYLFGCIKAQTTKRRYPKKRTHNDESRRSFSYGYQVKVDGVDVTVCRDEFLGLHGLQNSRGRLQHIQKMITKVGVVKSDGRGKHNNQPKKYTAKDIENVHEYVNSIPKYQSHYSRSQNPNRKYLNCDLTIEEI